MLSADWHSCDHGWLRRLPYRRPDGTAIYQCRGCGHRLLARKAMDERHQAAMRLADAEQQREASGEAGVDKPVVGQLVGRHVRVQSDGTDGVGGREGRGRQLPQAQRRHRRTSEEVDLLRARALLDDDLAELSDAERAWVWRSLLKGIRVDEACVLALVDLDRLDEAMEAVRARYEHRTLQYKARRAQEVAGALSAVAGKERRAG